MFVSTCIKVRNIINHLPTHLKICKLGYMNHGWPNTIPPHEMAFKLQSRQLIQWVIKREIISAISSRLTFWWDNDACLVPDQHVRLYVIRTMKQQYVYWHFIPLKQIVLTFSKFFARLCCILNEEAILP
jgi:hypothetical protein